MSSNKRWLSQALTRREARINRMFPRWQWALPLGDRTVIQPIAPSGDETSSRKEGSSR